MVKYGKKTKRSKSGYSKKKKYYKRRKTSYVKRASLRYPRQITKTDIYKPLYGAQQVHYYNYRLTEEVLLTTGLAPGTNAHTVQSMYLRTFSPDDYYAADKRFQLFFQLHAKYRLVNWNVTLVPTQTQVNVTSGYNATGQIVMFPVHDQGAIINLGLYSGGTLRVTDLDSWVEMPHAKMVKQNGGQLKPCSLNISPSVFKTYAADPVWGVSGVVPGVEPEYTKEKWYDTRDYYSSAYTMSKLLHYGIAIGFAGFDTPTTFQGFRIEHTFGFAFKGFDASGTIVASPTAVADTETKQPEVVEYYELKAFNEAPEPKKMCHDVRIDLDEQGKEVWRGSNAERNQQIRQNADEGYLHEDHYQEVDTQSVASALNSMKRPAPAPQATSSSSMPTHQIKRAFTNMKL